MSADEKSVAAVIDAIDRVNAEDPVSETDPAGGERVPRALLYGRRMTDRLQRLAPQANPLVRIAVRAQHIRRWSMPRSDYPQGRQGYHRWRRDLARYHAELTGELMAEEGFSEADIEHVGKLLRKEGLKTDADTQLLEDVAALVFLEHYMADFVAEHGHKYSDEKLLDIVRRTWRKMSDRGRDAALKLDLPGEVAPVVKRAVEGAEDD